MASITLTSLALLKARFDLEKRDILDAFVCFAEMCLAHRSPSNFSPEKLKEWLLSDFGLDLPLPPVNLILLRMSKRGIVERSGHFYNVREIKCEPEKFKKIRPN